MQRVLIVDDQPVFRRAARLVLSSSEGFEVVGDVESAGAALAFLERIPVGLVLMDVSMPTLNGVDAARRMLAIHQSVRVVLCSTQAPDQLPALPHHDRVRFLSKEALSAERLAALWPAG